MFSSLKLNLDFEKVESVKNVLGRLLPKEAAIKLDSEVIKPAKDFLKKFNENIDSKRDVTSLNSDINEFLSKCSDDFKKIQDKYRGPNAATCGTIYKLIKDPIQSYQLTVLQAPMSANSDQLLMQQEILRDDATVTPQFANLSKKIKTIIKGYDLVLMSTLPKNDKKEAVIGSIYISNEGRYVVRDIKGVVQEGVFDNNLIKGNLENELKKNKFIEEVLDVTSKAGHTYTRNELIKSGYIMHGIESSDTVPNEYKYLPSLIGNMWKSLKEFGLDLQLQNYEERKKNAILESDRGIKVGDDVFRFTGGILDSHVILVCSPILYRMSTSDGIAFQLFDVELARVIDKRSYEENPKRKSKIYPISLSTDCDSVIPDKLRSCENKQCWISANKDEICYIDNLMNLLMKMYPELSQKITNVYNEFKKDLTPEVMKKLGLGSKKSSEIKDVPSPRVPLDLKDELKPASVGNVGMFSQPAAGSQPVSTNPPGGIAVVEPGSNSVAPTVSTNPPGGIAVLEPVLNNVGSVPKRAV